MPPNFNVQGRMPLPSLQTYTSVSILLLAFSVYYALQVTSSPDWSVEMVKEVNVASENDTSDSAERARILYVLLDNGFLTQRLYEVISFMIQEHLCIWILVNMAYCCLILFGKLIQKIVFGELRVVEKQHMTDKFWNFVFYKLIFIFGVMNVQYMEEVVMWCGWFSVVGFFYVFAQLCRDRFEYLSFSPTTPKWTHIRLFTLIICILAVSVSLCIIVELYTSFNIFCFMVAECIAITFKTIYILTRYVLHLWDASYEGTWEKKGVYSYYSELVYDLCILTLNFMHHLHMLLWGNIFLSMASLVICMQLRFLFYEIQQRVIRHKNFLKVTREMEKNYPLATPEEIESNSDDCAICWDHMESARKLPCGHMFHTTCLRSWLEQLPVCPTCRTTLITKANNRPVNADINRNNLLAQEEAQARQANQTTNHFFHFDGSRYVSWFPSFSVEVSHTSILGERQPPPMQVSQLDSMAHQVMQLFPTMSYAAVVEDLRVTRSVEHTIENILEERVVTPQILPFPSTSSHGVSNVSNDHPSSSSSGQIWNPSTSSNNLLEMQSGSQDVSSSLSRLVTSSSTISDDSENKKTQSSMKAGGDGCRFSKSSQEREKMLSLRKDDLIKKARNKYISRIPVERSSIGGPSTSMY